MTEEPAGTTAALIAPCGLNCRLCRTYARARKPCPGCRGDDLHKSKSCVSCAIRNCEKLGAGGFSFCSACDAFPCARLRRLEKRYTSTYGVSVIGNLRKIQAGVEAFVQAENEKWLCPGCGAMLCMHAAQCAACGRAWR